MKKVTNAMLYDVQIKLVRLNINENNVFTLEGSLEYANKREEGGDFRFSLSPTELPNSFEKLRYLMNYAKVDNFEDLENSIIRIVLDETDNICALGDLMENNFFKIDGEFAIFTEEEILKE